MCVAPRQKTAKKMSVPLQFAAPSPYPCDNGGREEWNLQLHLCRLLHDRKHTACRKWTRLRERRPATRLAGAATFVLDSPPALRLRWRPIHRGPAILNSFHLQAICLTLSFDQHARVQTSSVTTPFVAPHRQLLSHSGSAESGWTRTPF
jgi:hypothetical protein